MAALYRSMLEWVIGDGRIGLIIKSKKPAVLASIPEVLPLLEKAIATGRCVRMENEWGRLPTDAASAADISVGAGISSAVIESVIAGYRGVHYDMTRLRSHEFYSWGYGRLVFDDLGKMMEALKKFASGTDEGIGDWSKYVDKLDPYHDGRGGARMGIYMKDLLDSIDSGATRDEAIGHADRSFMDKWGNDKVIKMERING
jgi:hypothetical protein